MPPKKPKDELVGFREFLEHDDKRAPERRAKVGGFELISFFEKDSKKIAQIIKLFEDKVYLLNQHDQFEKLNLEASEALTEKRSKLVEKISEDESIFKNNLDELLQSHFNS